MRLCSIVDCTNTHAAKGYCNNHYKQNRNYNKFGITEKCKVSWCEINKYEGSKGYCRKHYIQEHKYGTILKRTNRDPNEFIVEGAICKILIYNKHQNHIATALIDTKNIELCKRYKWCLSNGCVETKDKRKKIRIHRLILNTPKGMMTDHKNRNKLNNLESNLRVATATQNRINSNISSRNTSGYRGVSRRKSERKWTASIGSPNHPKGRTVLGRFKTKEEAALAYNKVAKEFFGEFATTVSRG